MSPPITGPRPEEIETVRPKNPKARPRSAPRKSCWMRPEFCGVRKPAAAPCTSRAPITQPAVGARPTAALAATNPASPSSIIRRRP